MTRGKSFFALIIDKGRRGLKISKYHLRISTPKEVGTPVQSGYLQMNSFLHDVNALDLCPTRFPQLLDEDGRVEIVVK